jgi:hypothetical protein
MAADLVPGDHLDRVDAIHHAEKIGDDVLGVEVRNYGVV